MDEKRRKRRDFMQNIAITLLSVCAVFLFTQTQLYNLGVDQYARFFSAQSIQMDGAAVGQTTGLAAPVRVAVSGDYGRYASVTMRTEEENFDPLRRILGEVLGSARSYEVCREREFLQALDTVSIYYDFLNPMPLSVLAGMVGLADAHDVEARLLVVASAEDSVKLYVWDGKKEYRRYDTAVTTESLESIVSQYEQGNARFVFEGLSQEEDLPELAPYTLILQEMPVLPVLTELIPAVNMEELLTTLQFNPNTKFRYTDSSGTEAVVENDRTLRLRTDGTIVYQSGGDPTLQVEVSGAEPSLQEIAAGSGALLSRIMTSIGGEAKLYLENVRQNGSIVTLTYGYEVGGVPIRFSDGAAAGTVTLSGTTVTAMSLRLRQYTATEEQSLLLPLRQAVAIAGRYEGAELVIGYAGDKEGRIAAQWLAE